MRLIGGPADGQDIDFPEDEEGLVLAGGSADGVRYLAEERDGVRVLVYQEP